MQRYERGSALLARQLFRRGLAGGAPCGQRCAARTSVCSAVQGVQPGRPMQFGRRRYATRPTARTPAGATHSCRRRASSAEAPAAAGAGAVRPVLFGLFRRDGRPSCGRFEVSGGPFSTGGGPGFQGFRGRDPDGLRIRLRQRAGGSGFRRRSGSPRLQPLPEGFQGGLFIKR